METYNEIYLSHKEKEIERENKMFGETKWWLKYPWDGSIIGTVNNENILSDELKNNSPEGDYNHTNVPNIDWTVLHSLIADEFLKYLNTIGITSDYIKENDWYAVTIKVDGWTLPFPTYEYKAYTISKGGDNEGNIEESVLNGFNKILSEIFKAFVNIVGEDNIPIEARYFWFSFDDIEGSIDYKYWTPSSDSFMLVYTKDEDGNMIKFVE